MRPDDDPGGHDRHFLGPVRSLTLSRRASRIRDYGRLAAYQGMLWRVLGLEGLPLGPSHMAPSGFAQRMSWS